MLTNVIHQICALSAIAGLAQSIELQSEEAQNLGSLSTLLGAFGLGQLGSSSGEVGDLISPIKTTLSQNGFGHMVEQKVHSHAQVEKTIKAHADPSSKALAHHLTWLRNGTKRLSPTTLSRQQPDPTCQNRANLHPDDPFMFLPVFSAQISATNPTATYESECFESIAFEYEEVSKTSFNVIVTASYPKEPVDGRSCSDGFLFANTGIQDFMTFP